MGLEQLRQVDAIGLDKVSRHVTLTIVDSWDWIDESAHAVALSEKVNAYLGFIESGELVASYPDAPGRAVEVLILAKYELPPAGERWLEHAQTVAAGYGVEIKFRHAPLQEPKPNGSSPDPSGR